MNDGPVFIVDDDFDDKEFFAEAWKQLEFKNELKFFNSAEDVLEFLNGKEIPFIVISDFNLPKMSGIELKKKLMETQQLHHKTIPFVFLTTTASQVQIEQAYNLCVNGIFLKETTFEGLKQQLIDIVRYWYKSKVPQ